MVAFETMVEKLKQEDEKNKHLSKVGQQLNVLDDLLSSAK